jgi:hypothetical protein
LFERRGERHTRDGRAHGRQDALNLARVVNVGARLT